MNGAPDARVRPAAADVAGHRVVDVLVRGIRIRRQEDRGRHDLSRLAVTALGDVRFEPRLLYGMREIGRETLDRDDRLVRDLYYLLHAGPNGLAVDVHRAGPAERHPAAEL